MKNSSKVLVALAAGVAAGGALGLLFAPDRGAVTRKKISGKAGKLMKKLGAKSAKEGLTIAKEKLERHLQKVNAKLQEFSAEDSRMN